MSDIKGHFGGVVERLDSEMATIRIETVHPQGRFNHVKKGDVVMALCADFMKQMPAPSEGSYVEGNVEHRGDGYKFTNVVRPV